MFKAFPMRTIVFLSILMINAVCVAGTPCFTTDEQAKNYSTYSQLQFEGAMKALSHYSFTGNERVLDVGCGDGKITKKIAEQLQHGFIVGLDVL